MRKLHKVALVGAVLGSVGSFGAGTALAHGEARAHDVDITQGIECRSHDMNIDVLGNLGALNPMLDKFESTARGKFASEVTVTH